MGLRPGFDLAQARPERAAQIVPQRNRPERHHRMPPFARSRAGERKLACHARLMEPGNEIARQERAVAGHAHDPLDGGRVRRHPIEPGQDASERAGEARDVVGDHRKPETGKARDIAVGVDEQARGLRAEPCHRPLQDRLLADADQRLVATAHAARQPARQDQTVARRLARGRIRALIRCLIRGLIRHGPPPCDGASRSLP